VKAIITAVMAGGEQIEGPPDQAPSRASNPGAGK
jgi:hypothetical protein